MASTVPDLMSRLRQSSARLNQLSDEAAATIKSTEEFLTKECSIGLYGSVVLEHYEEPGNYEFWKRLSFQKYKNKFRIVIVEYASYDPEESVKPWSDCDRETKISTIQLLPELLEDIAKSAEKKVQATEKALSTVEAQIGVISQKKKGE